VSSIDQIRERIDELRGELRSEAEHAVWLAKLYDKPFEDMSLEELVAAIEACADEGLAIYLSFDKSITKGWHIDGDVVPARGRPSYPTLLEALQSVLIAEREAARSFADEVVQWMTEEPA